jgi:DNA mismatch repair protein MutL
VETKIHVLSEEVISRIAAGEVVERPASVLKELAENALDAGARRVDVEMAGGGRDLIRVSDDGSGMSKADLALCSLPHATSKLGSADDLAGLRTLGFRGEALPSIASVSKFSITSRLRDGATDGASAWRIVLAGAQFERPQPVPAAGAYGTTVEVRELFYNVPARAKFLKGVAAEGAACIDTLLRLALTRPDVAFVLTQDHREILSLMPAVPGTRASSQQPAGEAGRPNGGQDARVPGATLEAGSSLPAAAYFQRAREALGRDSSKGLLEIALDEPSGMIGYRIFGLLSPPAITRPTRGEIFLNVNGRSIKDRTLTSALLSAYRNLLPGKRYPVAVLFLEMPPADVDVNVHPTKAEVRFRMPGLIYALLQNAVRSATGTAGLRPAAESEPALSASLAANVPPASSVSPWPAQLKADGQARFDLWPPALAAQPSAAAYGIATPRSPNVAEVVAPFAELAAPRCAAVLPEKAVQTDRVSPQAAPPAPFRVLGQAGGRYIVIEDDSGVKLIDQHALHERVLFEAFMKRSEGQARGDSQGLLIAETLELTPMEAAIYPEAEEILAQLGFEVEIFGPRALAVRALPAILKSGSASLVRDVLDALAGADEGPAGGRKPFERSYYREKAAYTVACKGALKAGERLTLEQMTALVTEYRKCAGAAGFTCPHGRPVALELSWADLERAVNRR